MFASGSSTISYMSSSPKKCLTPVRICTPLAHRTSSPRPRCLAGIVCCEPPRGTTIRWLVVSGTEEQSVCSNTMNRSTELRGVMLNTRTKEPSELTNLSLSLSFSTNFSQRRRACLRCHHCRRCIRCRWSLKSHAAVEPHTIIVVESIIALHLNHFVIGLCYCGTHRCGIYATTCSLYSAQV